MDILHKNIQQQYLEFLDGDTFPCLAAKIALKKQQVFSMVAAHMGCPGHDHAIYSFLEKFVDSYRGNDSGLYYTAAVIFTNEISSQHEFESMIWSRLQSISNLDAQKYNYDSRVNSDPSSDEFSFSIKEEAFFVIGLHPHNSRPARRFAYPALVFNPHNAFEILKQKGAYQKMQELVRERDIEFNGSANPMLTNFGEQSETFQYSGKVYDDTWKCPLNIQHGKDNNTTQNSTGFPAEERSTVTY